MKKRLCIGILAHVDAGKTTLSEAILYTTGRIRKQGRVDNRDTFLDTYALERERGITIFSKQAEFALGDTAVTLLDTPGHVDFSAETERTLSVLDLAILVVSGADGVQGHTETLWRLLARYRIPAFVFVNKMDQPGTERERLLAELKARLDGAITDFSGVAVEERDLNECKTAEPGRSVTVSGEGAGERAEELAMCDERLLEAYLEGGKLPLPGVQRAVRERALFPCYFGSALKLTGVAELLRGLAWFAPCPEYGDRFGARVFKVARDAQGTRLTYLKITGGTLRVKELLGGPDGEKINQIRLYSGEKYEVIPVAEAGCIAAVAGPAATRPGQCFGAAEESEQPLLMPVLTYQILLPAGLDAHKALAALRELEEEDPMLHIVWNGASGEIQAQVMGDVQMDVLKAEMTERFGMEIGFGAGNIVYKETIRETVEGVGHFEPLRHYAEVHLLLEPGEPGSGLVLEAACSEDMLDRNWQRLILTHLEEKKYRGVLTGSEITDMKITLIAGRAHIKHTEGGDFRQATYRAVRQGLREAGCRLLEPYYSFRLEVPAEQVGRAMADIDRMQGKFAAPAQNGETAILAGSVPVSEMRGYQQEVAAYTKGRGRLSVSLAGYEPCHNEAEVVERIGYDFDLDLQDPAGSVFCAHGAGVTVPWNEVKRYMHVESPFAKAGKRRTEADAALLRNQSAGNAAAAGNTGTGKTGTQAAGRSGKQRPGGSRLSASYYEDKELEEIFVRTYGPPKRRQPDNASSPRVIRAAGSDVKRKEKEEKEQAEEYLLVDGYNIIFAWEELAGLAKLNMEAARYKLMDILCNYQGFRKCTLIVIFDAYKVVGNPGEAIRYHNIHVIYTKEAETADSYIEKLAHRLGRERHVTVATSDGLEQLIIRGQGCNLLSARDFKKEVELAGRQIREETEKLTGGGKNYLLSHADERIKAYLEQVRLGERDETV